MGGGCAYARARVRARVYMRRAFLCLSLLFCFVLPCACTGAYGRCDALNAHARPLVVFRCDIREETGGAGSSTSAAAAGGGVVTVNPLGDRPSMDKDKRSSLKHNSHKTGRSLTAQRFAEMDWDTNGQVSFKEFLFAFEGWVGLDEDEDE